MRGHWEGPWCPITVVLGLRTHSWTPIGWDLLRAQGRGLCWCWGGSGAWSKGHWVLALSGSLGSAPRLTRPGQNPLPAAWVSHMSWCHWHCPPWLPALMGGRTPGVLLWGCARGGAHFCPQIPPQNRCWMTSCSHTRSSCPPSASCSSCTSNILGGGTLGVDMRRASGCNESEHKDAVGRV